MIVLVVRILAEGEGGRERDCHRGDSREWRRGVRESERVSVAVTEYIARHVYLIYTVSGQLGFGLTSRLWSMSVLD